MTDFAYETDTVRIRRVTREAEKRAQIQRYVMLAARAALKARRKAETGKEKNHE